MGRKEIEKKERSKSMRIENRNRDKGRSRE
jgi:hypothetical protein